MGGELVVHGRRSRGWWELSSLEIVLLDQIKEGGTML
jgi:hypothetical protein